MGFTTIETITKFEPNTFYDFMRVWGSPESSSYERLKKNPDGSFRTKLVKLSPDEEYTIQLKPSPGFCFYKDGLPVSSGTSFIVKGRDLLNHRYTIKTGHQQSGFEFKLTETKEQDIVGKISFTNDPSWGKIGEGGLNNDLAKINLPNTAPFLKFEGELSVGEISMAPLVKYYDGEEDPLNFCEINIMTPNVKLKVDGEILNSMKGQFTRWQLGCLSLVVPENTKSVSIATKTVDSRWAEGQQVSVLTVK